MHKMRFMHKIVFMDKNEQRNETLSTVSDQAFQSLRKDVLCGVHSPGSKLKLENLQTTYGFSSSPLREALNRLVQEGLVKADERKGFKVSLMSPEDLSDITKMRLMLDIPALREAMQTGDDTWEASIVSSFHRLEKIESRLPTGPAVLDAEWSQRHKEFHASMLSACPSERQ